MFFFQKIKAFVFFDTRRKLLLTEAFIYLAWGRILKSKPFPNIAPALGEYMDETSMNFNSGERIILKNITDAIHIMSKYTFWESQCLVKAIAALKMLERRKIESTLYLGTAKDKSGNLIAHAWLRSGPFYITGFEGKERFTVVGKFAKRINPKIRGDLDEKY